MFQNNDAAITPETNFKTLNKTLRDNDAVFLRLLVEANVTDDGATAYSQRTLFTPMAGQMVIVKDYTLTVQNGQVSRDATFTTFNADMPAGTVVAQGNPDDATVSTFDGARHGCEYHQQAINALKRTEFNTNGGDYTGFMKDGLVARGLEIIPDNAVDLLQKHITANVTAPALQF